MTLTIDVKVQTKLRKLQALAERGVGGEKDNAQRMLEKLLARHGLTIDDLADERREIRWFPAANKFESRLALQILSKICNTSSPDVYRHKQKPKLVGVRVTPAEAIEFELHYDALRKALGDHFQDAFSAFIQVNRLFPSNSGEEPEANVTERDFRVMSMAAAIQPTAVNPRIAGQKDGGAL
ncbi:DUF2786 domain-containing protein [Pseudomonas juntendi]|uniref:DUF2786 domain-containing protein n=1 Tax=Pseudomonas juntendi TaxID=2666183 RepID=UPI0021B392F7|nr:DUF2786 domain-containing protein [Pseudomonas juntendi]UXA39113.1 DUF2786 domain-containing protein [Pseudomonas juntendi]